MLQRILKESITYGIAGAASQLVGILLVPLYTRVLTPSELGLLDLLLAVSGVAVLASGLQVESGVGRSYFEARERGEKVELVGTALGLYAAGALVCGVALVAAFAAAGDRFPDVGWRHLAPIALAVLPTHLLGIAQIVLRFERRVRAFVALSVGDVLTSGLLALVAIVYLDRGIAGYLWALFASKVVWSLAACGVMRDVWALRWRPSYAREILAFSVPTVPNVLVGWAQNYGNRFILVAFLSTLEVGIFGLAVRVASVAGMAIMAFRMAWYPYSYEIMGRPGFEAAYARMLKFYWVFGFALCAMMGACGDILVRVFAGHDYAAAGRLVGFLAMGLLWNGALLILGLGIDYARKTYLSFFGFASGTAVNLLALTWTVERHGARAAGVAYLAGSIVTVLVILWLAQRQLRVPYRAWDVAVVAALSLALPWWFAATPAPAGAFGPLLADAAVKCLLTAGVCALLFLVTTSRDDRAELAAQVRRLPDAGRRLLDRRGGGR